MDKNGVETIVDNDRILWLNGKRIEGLDHKKLQMVSLEYHSKKYQKSTAQQKFNKQKLAVKVIMDCRTTSAYKFRTKLGFKQYHIILSKEQSMLTKIICLFDGENTI